jgi:hypothetical protein
MTIRRAALAAFTGVALLATPVVAPAGAQEQESDLLPLSITPTTGPAGTAVTAGGAGCAPQQAFNAFIQVYFADQIDVLNAAEGEISDNGTWSLEVTVPAGTDPAGTYSVFATCFVNNGEDVEVAAEYEAAPFDVTGDVITPGPQAAPAAPVPGDPTFTG